ncbi:MAG: tetratricopeptide repeat protein, partial [Muribaculaceae bacterium]|nr:tetratricopeptide repeat protein [Muribaculaceae bacterium]
MSEPRPTVSHRLTALAAAAACAIAIILPMLTATGAQTPERDFTVDPALTQKSDSIAAEAMAVIQTDLPRAIGLFKECAAIERANLGHDHPYYANTLINLASAMIMAGHSDSAIVMSRQAAAIHQACYGTYSTEYAEALSTYCLALHMTENLDSIKTSVRLRQQSIDICDHLGDTAMAALERFFKASDCLTLAQNTNDEAEKEALLCAGIESGRRATPSDNQREIMRALLQSRAMIYAKRNLSDQAFRLTNDEFLANEQVALDCFSESLAYGGDTINIMGSHLRTGQALCNAGKYADAIGHLETVAGYMRNHSEYAANLVTTLGSLAVTYIKAGDFIKVMAIGDETESLVAQAGTYLSADAAGAFADIATALSGINEFDKAETFASKGLALAAAVKEQNPMPYLQLLTALAVINKERGNPTEAYNLYIECLDLAEASFPADHMAVVSMRNAMMAMMIDYSMPGWIPLFEKQKQVMAAAPQFSAAYAHMLSKAAKGYLALDIYDKALALNSEAINTLPDRENDSANFIELSLQKARILARMHDYNKARAAVDTLLANQSLSLPQRITALETRYIINYDSRDLTSALDDISQCNELYASLYGDPDNAAQIKSLSDMGTIYVNLGQYARADSVRRKAIEIAEKIYTKQSAPYLQALVELEMTPEFGNPYRQRDRQLEYLEFIGEHYGKNTAAYATQQMKSADILGKLGLRQQALTLAMEAIKTLEEYQGEQSQSFIGALVSAASHQYNAGLYDETIKTATRAIDLTEKYHPQAAQRVVNAMGWLIEAHSSANDYGTAIYQGQRLAEYTESKFGRGSLQHTKELYRLAMQYMHLGNYETSSNLCREIIGLTEADNTITDEYKDETVWNLLANNYQYQGRHSEALEIAQKLYDKCQNRTGIDFTVVSHNLAAAYNMMGRHQQALELSDAVMHSDGLALVDMPNMANIYLKNGKIIAMAGNKEQGLAMMRRGMEMRDSIYRGQGRYVLLGLNDLISVCDSTGDLAARDSYAMRLSTLTRDFVRQSFLTLPAKGRHAMWQQHSDFMLNRFAGYAAGNP